MSTLLQTLISMLQNELKLLDQRFKVPSNSMGLKTYLGGKREGLIIALQLVEVIATIEADEAQGGLK